ncbi:TOBE domain-containing protein [Magnetospirillum aberrantis]|uniref:LysR family transcriptional regulator n=1 Tax=Magnetospirillum aberrantis SpK TaxID=908842 RepID=A0A7C9QWQ2_9PROT|nr:TOBE domain-containing protein [Magnetospirillum aberrantis]NFV81999.1 LysR family transcriptional regulator [Magnetospirillum aberrantis SpK]
MSDIKIDAMLALRREGRPLVGRDRIDLLEAVAAHGSITKAAKAVGLSYKGAWDALNAVNNLLPRPAIASQTGGRHGGGATLTEDGRALIAAFRLLEDRLGRVASALGGGNGTVDPLSLLWSLGMKTSARNAFRCVVDEVRSGSINAEVIMRLSSSATLTAVITGESVRDLGVAAGREVMALVKSSFVMLAPAGQKLAISARNRIQGTVSRREDGPVSSEFTLDIGDGKSITAVVTRDAADELALNPGDEAVALFKASHVILAVD